MIRNGQKLYNLRRQRNKRNKKKNEKTLIIRSFLNYSISKTWNINKVIVTYKQTLVILFWTIKTKLYTFKLIYRFVKINYKTYLKKFNYIFFI